MDQDYSISEFYELILLLSTSIILFRSQKREFFLISLLILYFAFDNLFAIHELSGVKIAKIDFLENLSISTNTGTQALAEIVYFFVLGILSLLIFATSINISSRSTVKFILTIAACIGIIFSGGVVFDFLRETPLVNMEKKLAGFIEDTIELIGIALLFLYTLSIKHQLPSESTAPNLPS